MTATQVGTVQALTLFPVKSMRALNVNVARLYWYGFDGDRKYAFSKHGSYSGFPWVTARERPELLRYQPRFDIPDDPPRSDVYIVMPLGEALSPTDSRLRDSLGLGSDTSLIKLSRGTFDCMPVSLLSSSSVRSLEHALARPLDVRRFRANILLETASSVARPEDNWQGATLRFGDRAGAAQLHVTYRTRRCVMINLDPETGEHDPHVLTKVAAGSAACMGVYGTPQRPGELRVGDAVYLEA